MSMTLMIGMILGWMMTLMIFSWLLYKQRKIAKEAKEQYSKLLSQKKSGEVILGGIAEKLAPFLDDFPIKDDTKELNFLGMPIDYIHFGKEKVTFVEVKSGNSQLSKKQRDIKKLITGGKVEFIVHRIK